MELVTISSAREITGVLDIPGDKSISHRALILSSLVKCSVQIANLNQGEDVAHTKNALELLGVNIQNGGNGMLKVDCLDQHGTEH